MSNTPSDPSLAIEVRGLYKAFGATAALRDVSLQLEWGGVLSLFGPNGAGKSTLLRTLATLSRHDHGDVRVAGYDRAKQAAQIRAAVGYVGHQPLLYDDLTPAENLHFYARLYNLTDREGAVRRALTDVGLGAWAERKVRTLSNGMQKRTALARALLHRPAVLLLDEPETGLDQEGLALLERIVRGAAEGGAAVVMSTHAVDRGLALADRVAALAAGRLVLDAAKADVGPADLRSVAARASEAGA